MKMKERDYINVRELSDVMAARTLIRGICQENSEVMTKEDFVTVNRILDKWQDELFAKIQTEE